MTAFVREPGGLFVGEKRVPLRGVAIDVRARGVASRTTVTQRYRNDESVPVEAVYSFPLEEGAAVCAFEVEIDGKRIVAKAVEKEAAFEKYDDAMSRGHGAFLLDQDRPNIFTASVGNLLPGQEVAVRLAYVAELSQTGDEIRLAVPTTISPRYVPQEQIKAMDPAELDHIAPPTILGGVPYGLRLTAELEAPSAVRSVECPSHPARVSLDGRKVRVEVAGENVQLDQDFVVNVTLERAHEASAVVAREPDGARVAMVNVFPDLSGLPRQACEAVFVVDRSGSMMGESIEEARNALLLCLRSLEEGDRFNIVGFGSDFEMLFPESVPYSQKTLDEATAHVQAIDAEMGGTEIMQPLRKVLTEAPGSLPRQILLLTDGEVGNERECIDLAAKHSGNARIFTFGIGRGASEFLVRGLARATRGASEFIHPGERIEPKVMRQFGRVAVGSLRDVRVDWGPLEVDQVAPAEPPPLFPGDRCTFYGRVKGGRPGEVAIVAEGPGGRLRFAVMVDPEKAEADDVVPALMARRAIQDLEEGRTDGKKGASAKRAKKDAVRARIVVLGCKYGLLSSATSFVAVEERPATGEAVKAELRRVPIALTKSWHGTDRARPMMAGAACFSLAGAGSVSSFLGRAVGRVAQTTRGVRSAAVADGVLECRCASMIAPSGRAAQGQAGVMPPAIDDPLIALTLGQQADGSWPLGRELAAAAGVPTGVLGKAALALSAASGKLPESRAAAVVATLVVLYLLRTKYADRESEWRLLARKADRWLKKAGATAPQGATGAQDLAAWTAGVIEGSGRAP
ncbi:MAG: VWA domain-containing protein [Deltaproteobacteria bacterium]|nr:VWA domain-containing protein [Deltaproteobacteria bacterium]